MISAEDLNVSRETFANLKVYADLLEKWNPKINLVSRASLRDLWTRHIMDSAQLMSLAPNPCKTWVDLGSGGGFPGLVIAIMALETGSPKEVVLIESDSRKCAFLRTVIRETGAKATVLNQRIEQTDQLSADVLTARALADLTDLLGFAERHLSEDGTALFPKGAQWQKELSDAQSLWNFDYRVDTSLTEAGPVILSVTGVSRV
ncbi:MAG: 16S rRNA (guanine(527)-N(7))-methyltransferase RsmG [Roseovarius sp.]|nr:16S rRNA (guanine(527)-N(7))-methyltransferase RsmG [Roseovarius sp.]